MELDGFSDASGVLRAGVYALVYQGEVIYIGKAKALYSRIYSHKSAWTRARSKKRDRIPRFLDSIVKGFLFDQVFIRPCRSDQLDLLEQQMIHRYQPKHNIRLRTTPVPADARIVLAQLTSATVTRTPFERRF